MCLPLMTNPLSQDRCTLSPSLWDVTVSWVVRRPGRPWNTYVFSCNERRMTRYWFTLITCNEFTVSCWRKVLTQAVAAMFQRSRHWLQLAYLCFFSPEFKLHGAVGGGGCSIIVLITLTPFDLSEIPHSSVFIDQLAGRWLSYRRWMGVPRLLKQVCVLDCALPSLWTFQRRDLLKNAFQIQGINKIVCLDKRVIYHNDVFNISHRKSIYQNGNEPCV